MGIILILLMILSSEIEQSRAVEASLSVDAVHGASGVPGGIWPAAGCACALGAASHRLTCALVSRVLPLPCPCRRARLCGLP
ncbi:hypothetical protein GDR29_07025 [Xanthomonas oryzae pv. oryzae]|nr:hypothetical protein GDR29_07025 [Xanthomonas oryzae pv. oryzae]